MLHSHRPRVTVLPPHVLPVSGGVSVLDFSRSDGHTVVSHYSNLHFPNDKRCRTSFHVLFAICISLIVRYLFRSLAHLLNGLFAFLPLPFKNCLYILLTSPLSNMCFFPQSVARLLILLTLSFTERKFYIFIKMKL